MKSCRLRKEYNKCCTKKEINRIASLKAGVSQLIGNKRGAEKDKSGIYLDSEVFKSLL
jgi:hypothetical protein